MDSKEDISNSTVEYTERKLPTEPVQDEAWLAAEKSLVRKLDLSLMPMVWILYLFNYLDRNNIAQARLNSFEEDLGLKGSEFNTAVSILNLIAIRFLLGIAEAPFFPGAMYLISCWYPKRQIARRAAVLYSGLILATAFSGLFAAGIFEGLDGKRGLAGWQWLFVIEGAGSFIVAMVSFVLLPDYPGQKTGVSKWLLNDMEQKVAQERMLLDRAGQPEVEGSAWSGLRSAVKDVRMWVFTLMLLANHSAYGFNNFFPTIVKGFKLGNNTLTLVLTAPPYLVATFVAFAVAWSSDSRKERCYHISVPQAVACIGFIISVATLNKAARYTAAFLYICGCFSSNAMVFSWALNTLSETPEKRACSTAIINVVSQLGNIYSPYFFPSSDGPRYTMAMLLMMAFSAMSVVTCVVMKVLLTRQNKRLLEAGETRLYIL
ncbi:hypothetical protein Daus18300_005110 [Diaporthe australafricana]|uniref:Major facilitator superfamily (MFS) profile domain-containing protein n=1 Tax=Diaporthe australafricana TaxID=127596 RepID=A0ABR3X473_9PEZI